MIFRQSVVGIVILAFALMCEMVAAQEITVAAAADLQSVMQDLAAQFQKETGKSAYAGA